MICPECMAEYREGFARCANCGVELVERLPGAMVTPERADSPTADEDDPFCEFWRGDDPRLQGELCQVLGEAGIPYRTLQMNDVLNMMGIPVRHAAFRIGVPFSLFEKGEKAIAEAFGGVAEANSVLHPTEENQPGFRKLLELPLEEKFKKVPLKNIPSFWDQVTWKRKKPDEDQADSEEGNK
jgi:hypothetical protein